MKASVKDLRYNLKTILESVDRGEEVLITNRGRVKARIVAADTSTVDAAENPFIGMWKDRTDMKNVEQYVRDMRKGRVAC
jgi:prevent-host-death family protein